MDGYVERVIAHIMTLLVCLLGVRTQTLSILEYKETVTTLWDATKSKDFISCSGMMGFSITHVALFRIY